MSRIRITLITALVVAVAAVAINSQAQPPPGGPGGPGGRGQRGGGPGGGPGGPGGWSGPEGPGGNLIMLAGNDGVQKELKMTDRQKAMVKRIADDQGNKWRDVMQQVRQQTDLAKAQAAQEAQGEAQQGAQIDPTVDARGSGAGNPLAGALNSRGYQPQVFAGQPQIDPAQQQQAAQFQGQQADNAARAQGRQLMREAMQQLQHESEGELARVLDRNQVKRLKEIQLQVEGPAAVIREDVAEKLEITEDQHAEIQDIVNEAKATRRQLMAKGWEMMRSLMPPPPGGGNQPGQGGLGGPGGQGGRGGQNRPQFDPEAFQKLMEKPEVKAKIDEAQKEQKQHREREYAMVYKAMDSRQRSAFKKMLGKPFDVESIRGGFFRGGPGGRRNGANGNADQAKDAPKSDTAKTEPAAKADSGVAASNSTTTPRRQSLRDRRGLGGQQLAPGGSSPN